MSAQERSKKPSLLARIFCCVSPEPVQDSPSKTLAAPPAQQVDPRHDHTTTTMVGETPAASAQPQADIGADQATEKVVSESLTGERSDDTRQDAHDADEPTQGVTMSPEDGERTRDTTTTTSVTAGLAPPLAQDGQGSTIVDNPHHLAAASLPEENAALADDEPLTPSSASITATVPVKEIEDEKALAEPPAGESSPQGSWLLPPLSPDHHGRKCLVLDLDETLVHSSFKVIHQADFVVPVEIDGIFHNVYVIKRPGVDDFMRQVGEHFEIVVFTASLAKYADPVLDILDIHKVVHHRLFRESCHNHMGNYVKDLSQLGRNLKDAIIIDNSPASYVFHPAHAVPISSWFNDVHDTELTDLIPFLIDLTDVDDVSQVLELRI